MVHTLSTQSFELSAVTGWAAGDSRRLTFVVTQDGEAKNIESDTLEWQLLERPYHIRADAVLDDDSDGVTLSVLDGSAGEFRVVVDAGATVGLWGRYSQRVVVDPPGETRQSWRGDVVIEDAGE